MIHVVSEGERMRYGLNIEPCWRVPMWGQPATWKRGVAFVVFWRGLRNYYAIRLRLRHPGLGPMVAGVMRSCIKCHPEWGALCARHRKPNAA